jgi:peptidoglycan/LPS O-acetylase OafA/YrhL
LTLGLPALRLPLTGSTGYVLKAARLFFSFFVLCLVCFREPSGWLARASSWTPLRWLRNMSYSYYLLHGLALHASFLVLAHVLPRAVYGP